MKILSIKLRNLNSLRGEHAVEFDKDPLAGAGLFCITGPTGAGKSTLLDALTLALYGRAARYTGSNPEDMMSRHCGECRAEVEFEVEEGRFRAEWQLHRARKKADGKVQSAKRFVYDAAGNVRAETINEADRLVEELTGLDYERFLRSVMLAQGEFSKFLKANADERATLLESLTGTSIYSDLSTLANEELSRRTGELTTKQALLGAITLLTPELRAEREAEVRRVEAEHDQTTRELEEVNKRWQQASRLRESLKAESDLRREEEALRARQTALQPEWERLARHRETEQWSEPLARLAAAEASAAEAEGAWRRAQAATAAAHREWAAGLWAGSELAQRFAEEKEKELEKARETLAAATRKTREVEQWLTDHASDAALGEKLPELAVGIQQLADKRRALAAASRQLTGLTANISTTQKAREHATGVVKAALDARAAAEARHRQAGQSLAALLGNLSEAALSDLVENLTKRSGVLEQLADRRRQLEGKQKSAAESSRSLQATARSLPVAAAELARAEERVTAAKTELALRRDHFEKAQLVASFEEHRGQLRPGEMCPLCGSLEHPLAGGAVPGPGLETLRQVVRKSEQETTRCEQARTTAYTQLQRLQADESAARRALGSLAGEVAELEQQLAAQATRNEIANTNSEILESDQRECAQACEAARTRLREARAAREQLTLRAASLAKAEANVSAAKAQVTVEERQFAKAVADHAEAQRQVAGQEVELAECTAELSRVLQPWGRKAPEIGREADLSRALQNRRSLFQEQAQAREKNLVLCAHLETETGSLREKARRSRDRATLLAGQRQVRGVVEPGLSPAELDRARQGWANLDQVEAGCDELEKRFEENRIAGTMHDAQRLERQQTARQCATTLESQLAGTTFGSITGAKSARMEPSAVARVERLADTLKTEQAQLRGALAQTRKTIADLRAEGTAEPADIPNLEARSGTLRQAKEAALGRLGALRHDLAQDTQNRANYARQAAVLQAEETRLVVWTRLQGLIGSYDGRKFRRFAQGISLDVLVRHANRHLTRLTDRYQIRRHAGEELDLEMEDLYQAGALRPTASLSGGESFLASLALALGLADLAGRNTRIDSLFIDEGFGSLDSDSLDVAISALESLRQDSKMVGVISHVPLLKERIATCIQVDKLAGGFSTLSVART